MSPALASRNPATAMMAPMANYYEEEIMGVVQPATVTLTDAQIKERTGDGALTELIAAPGAGKLIVPIRIVYSTNIQSAYTNQSAPPNDRYITAWYGDFAYDPFSGCLANGIFNNSFATMSGIRTPTDATNSREIGDTIATIANKALGLELYNLLGAFTGGHASNTLTITVLFAIVDV